MVSLKAHEAATSTRNAKQVRTLIKRLNQPEPPRNLDGSGVLHVVEMYSTLSL